MRHFLRILAVVAVLGSPLASPAAQECHDLFRAQSLAVVSSNSVQTVARVDRATVQILRRATNSSGETFLLLKKINDDDTWRSNYTKRGFDPQGDPTSVFASLGPSLASILGFTMVNETQMRVPTPETFNARIESFNRHLVAHSIKPIRLRFYWQEKPTIDSFLEGWSAEVPSLPFASDLSAHSIHDISYHVSGILLTDSVLELLQVYAKLTQRWLKFHPSSQSRSFAEMLSAGIDTASVASNEAPSSWSGLHLFYFLPLVSPVPSDSLIGKFAVEARKHRQLSSPDMATQDVRIFESASWAFYDAMKSEPGPWNQTFGQLDVQSISRITKDLLARRNQLQSAADSYLRSSR